METTESQKRNEDTIRSELVFTVPLLMEFPKCYWIWKYRLWMLQQAVQMLPLGNARAIWEEELGLVGKMLSRDHRNFHAWGYRRHVVSQLEAPNLSGKSMVEAEFAYTTKMVQRDLSNFSAWHNRSQLIPRLLEERNADKEARTQFLDDGEFSQATYIICSRTSEFGLKHEAEFENIRSALNVGPEDQSLWYYHQFLINAVCKAVGTGPIVSGMAMEDCRRYVANEIDFIQELLEDYSDVKLIYEALVEYTLVADKLTTDGLTNTDKQSLSEWLKQLRDLDKKRQGRWKELEARVELYK